ncbi:biotin--[acetyl-CoA-carboxylase] ligase [Marinigracilibium pacificum]|uniref:Biotin--[acetyl-CoA-carboxylase] ligase n=1 Tax=Marinigracilibium pacificum TaxID=2729599 RepID=A0A848IYW6_9BACT|nr:biotin--[acetyl-CoA-carboxylase] ligase [Marinigracilibium pacificum]NMM49467.1 biotin--[acetyl-CoA-carboxylase] ligase [Marinigracilibium pacificum]
MHKNSTNLLILGRTSDYLPSCQSTNDIAAEMLSTKNPIDGHVVWTTDQTAGKGQRGNTWESEPGKNLLLSIILYPKFLNASNQFLLTMAISLGVRDAIQFLIPNKEVLIKWPNDIYVENYKIAGILIENTLKNSNLDQSIVGIGSNVNQRDKLHEHATSIATELGSEVEINDYFQLLLKNIEVYYLKLRSGKESYLKSIYYRKMLWYQEEKLFSSGEKYFHGTILGVNNEGKIQISTEEGIRSFGLKEIKFIINR